MKDKDQLNLFDSKSDWQDEWQDMPEFVQPSIEAVASVVVHFETFEDMRKFSAITGAQITPNTRSFFFPQKKTCIAKVYRNES